MPGIGLEKIDEVEMRLKHALIVNDKFGIAKGEEPLAVSIAAFGIDEHDEVHGAAIFHL